jgi:hypothetical protein
MPVSYDFCNIGMRSNGPISVLQVFKEERAVGLLSPEGDQGG